MNLGVQYYRPPFPVDTYWEDDFARIKQSGLDTIQLWVVWAWVEPNRASSTTTITTAWWSWPTSTG